MQKREEKYIKIGMEQRKSGGRAIVYDNEHKRSHRQNDERKNIRKQ